MNEIENLEISHEMAMTMVQTMSKAELEGNILQEAIKFFTNGFKTIVSCIKAIFAAWMGIGISIAASASAGISVLTPGSGSFTFDYCYSQPGIPYVVVGKKMCDGQKPYAATPNTVLDSADVQAACSANIDCQWVAKEEKNKYSHPPITQACWYLLKSDPNWNVGNQMMQSNKCQDGKMTDTKKPCVHGTDFLKTGVLPARAQYTMKKGACRGSNSNDKGKLGQDYVATNTLSNGACKSRCDELGDCKAFDFKIGTNQCGLWKVAPKFSDGSGSYSCYIKGKTHTVPGLPKKDSYQTCYKNKCKSGYTKLWRKPKGCCAWSKGACDTCSK